MTINVSVDSLVEMTLGCCYKCYAEGRIYFLSMDILALVKYAIDFGLNNKFIADSIRGTFKISLTVPTMKTKANIKQII